MLILIDWFAPGYKAGGPIQSCVNIAFALKDEYDLFVLTTDTDHGETKPYPNILTNQWHNYQQSGIQIYYAKKNSLSFKQIADEIKIINADFVYLNLLFSPFFAVYPLWLTAKNKIVGKVIACPRGTLYDSALSLKAYKKKPLLYIYRLLGIDKKIIFHATNERESDAIKKYFPKSKIIIADNLPGTKQAPFTSCNKQQGSVKCIFIARIVPIKNLLYLLNILATVKEHVTLTIVGPAENYDYWNECKQAIEALPQNIIIAYLGAQKNEMLPGLLQQNHLFILPTNGENFGHAIFESLSAGRPVLISDQTPWLGLEKYKAGWDLPLSDSQKFAAIISAMAQADQQQFDEYAFAAWQYAERFINTPKLKQQYYTLFS